MGPLERHYWEGGPEGVERRGPKQTLKGVETFLGGAKFEEASANYLFRCVPGRNVALLPQKCRQTLIYLWKSEENFNKDPDFRRLPTKL